MKWRGRRRERKAFLLVFQHHLKSIVSIFTPLYTSGSATYTDGMSNKSRTKYICQGRFVRIQFLNVALYDSCNIVTETSIKQDRIIITECRSVSQRLHKIVSFECIYLFRKTLIDKRKLYHLLWICKEQLALKKLG